MSENKTTLQTITIGDEIEFPVTVKLPTGAATLVGEITFAHDVDYYYGFHIQGDPEGKKAIVFLAWKQEFEVV